MTCPVSARRLSHICQLWGRYHHYLRKACSAGSMMRRFLLLEQDEMADGNAFVLDNGQDWQMRASVPFGEMDGRDI